MTDERTMQQPTDALRLIRMDEVQETETQWLWFPYIPYGKITIIQGDPGEGKTTLVLHLAAALTRGEMLGFEEQREPVTVIYQTAEDGLADTIKPRLLSASADCSKVLVIDETEQSVSMTDERLETAIRQTNARLVMRNCLERRLRSTMQHKNALAAAFQIIIRTLQTVIGRSLIMKLWFSLGTVSRFSPEHNDGIMFRQCSTII